MPDSIKMLDLILKLMRAYGELIREIAALVSSGASANMISIDSQILIDLASRHQRKLIDILDEVM